MNNFYWELFEEDEEEIENDEIWGAQLYPITYKQRTNINKQKEIQAQDKRMRSVMHMTARLYINRCGIFHAMGVPNPLLNTVFDTTKAWSPQMKGLL